MTVFEIAVFVVIRLYTSSLSYVGMYATQRDSVAEPFGR